MISRLGHGSINLTEPLSSTFDLGGGPFAFSLERNPRVRVAFPIESDRLVEFQRKAVQASGLFDDHLIQATSDVLRSLGAYIPVEDPFRITAMAPTSLDTASAPDSARPFEAPLYHPLYRPCSFCSSHVGTQPPF